MLLLRGSSAQAGCKAMHMTVEAAQVSHVHTTLPSTCEHARLRVHHDAKRLLAHATH